MQLPTGCISNGAPAAQCAMVQDPDGGGAAPIMIVRHNMYNHNESAGDVQCSAVPLSMAEFKNNCGRRRRQLGAAASTSRDHDNGATAARPGMCGKRPCRCSCIILCLPQSYYGTVRRPTALTSCRAGSLRGRESVQSWPPSRLPLQPAPDLPSPRGMPSSDWAPPRRDRTHHSHPSHRLHPPHPSRPQHSSCRNPHVTPAVATHT